MTDPGGLRVRLPDHAAEADVRGRGVDGLALPGCRSVAEAVVRRAQVGAALDHLAREALALTGEWSLRRAARPAARTPLLQVVGRPLPDVTRHVVEAVAV